MSMVGIGAEGQAEKEKLGEVGEVGERVICRVWEMPILQSEMIKQRCTEHNDRLPVGR